MKWVNIGTVEGFSLHSKFTTQVDKEMQYSSTTRYIVGDDGQNLTYKLPQTVTEAWVSFDVALPEGTSRARSGLMYAWGFDTNNDNDTVKLPCCLFDTNNGAQIQPKIGLGTYEARDRRGQILYDPDVTWDFRDKKPHNIEIHVKTGDKGRIDVWFDHKLSISYRSPSAFPTNINYFKLRHAIGGTTFYFSSFILQDTRRIGYEKFVKLKIDPVTEQNMPQGSTTTYTLSGLTDSSEFSDITSVVAVLQATSRDANITTGTYNLNGATVGTIDVSDSSGKAYEVAHAEVNNITGLPFTRDDIEGQTLSFTVNGAE